MLYYLCFSPLDRYRAPLCDRECDWEAPISRPISHPNTVVGVLNRLVLNPLGGSTARDSGALVCQNPFKTSAKRKRDRGRDSQPRPRPRLKSQPQGATKIVRGRGWGGASFFLSSHHASSWSPPMVGLNQAIKNMYLFLFCFFLFFSFLFVVLSLFYLFNPLFCFKERSRIVCCFVALLLFFGQWAKKETTKQNNKTPCFPVVRGLLGTDPPDPTLESASPSPPQGSIAHQIRKSISWFDPISMSNWCCIDAKSTLEEGRARRIRGWGLGGLCLINPSQFYSVFVCAVVFTGIWPQKGQ